ncbi:MAG: hypothetical protein DRP01_07165 [Archaeoglobales archaeon]|nr:MAG: hypothetical protein DRP01_07165 [Archaeoglobales archaeon]
MKGLGIKGNVLVKVREKRVEVPSLETILNFDNTLVQGGLELFGKILGTPGYDAGTVYLELGKSDIAPNISDVALYAPYFRKAIGVSYQSNVLQFSGRVLNWEALLTAPDEIKEMGLFWDGGSLSLGSGTMIARVLFRPSFTKTVAEEIDVYWSYRMMETFIDLAEPGSVPVGPTIC